jgi:hypothetical protein
MTETELAFVRDVIRMLQDQASEAKAGALNAGEFERGRRMAYYEVLSLIEQQATAFGIPPKSLGLENFVADRDVL